MRFLKNYIIIVLFAILFDVCFFVRYEHATGRVAVLDMLETVIKRFPVSIINEQAETFFVHLVLALANDHDNHVRYLIGIVLKHLIDRISPQTLESILSICLTWYLGENQQLRSPAAQVKYLMVFVCHWSIADAMHLISFLKVLLKCLNIFEDWLWSEGWVSRRKNDLVAL